MAALQKIQKNAIQELANVDKLEGFSYCSFKELIAEINSSLIEEKLPILKSAQATWAIDIYNETFFELAEEIAEETEDFGITNADFLKIR